MTPQRIPITFSLATFAILSFSFALAQDRFTWILEVFPILIGFPILLATYKRFPLTRMLYILLTVHFCILALGGIYTYAKVPLGFWMQDWFGFARNHYDRIGHFAQGFIPAILVRELLLRTSPLRPGKWMNFICIAICLAISAFYELIEWWTAASQGASADAFLGSQGDVWDAQWDMFFCLLGATSAIIALRRLHDRALNRRIQ